MRLDLLGLKRRSGLHLRHLALQADFHIGAVLLERQLSLVLLALQHQPLLGQLALRRDLLSLALRGHLRLLQGLAHLLHLLLGLGKLARKHLGRRRLTALALHRHDRRRQHRLEPPRDRVGLREVHVPRENVHQQRRCGRRGAHHLSEHRSRFVALGRKRRSSFHDKVILAARQFVDLRGRIGGRCAIDGNRFGLAILAKHPQDSRLAVDMRDQVDDDPPAVTYGAAQVVDVVKRRHVAFALPGHDRAATRLVAASAEACVVDARYRLQVIGSVQSLLQRAGGHACEGLTLRRDRAVILDERVSLAVRRLPLAHIRIERAARPDERRLRCERDQFGRHRAPHVEHELHVAHVPHHRLPVAPALDVDFLAVDRNDRDMLPRPFVGFQNLAAGHHAVLDLVAARRPLALDGHALRNPQVLMLLVELAVDHLAAAQQHDRLLVLVALPILGDADAVLGPPQLVFVVAVG